jgi:hypothetical protein
MWKYLGPEIKNGAARIAAAKADKSCVAFPNGQNFVDVKTKSKYALRLYNDGTLEQISDKNKGTWNCNASDKCSIDFKMDSHQSSNVSMSFTETLVPCNSGKSKNAGGGNNTNALSNQIKEIQSALGLQPTGQLSDEELTKILAALGGESQQDVELPTTADGQLDLTKILASL